jgi:GAF domain-containing protein
VLGEGEAVVIDDVRGDAPLAASFRAVMGDLFQTPSFSHVRSMIVVPIVHKQQALGVLTVSRDVPGYFTQENARLVRAIADQAAVGIENARLFAETEARARETEALIRADEDLFRSLNLDAVFQALSDVAVDVLKVDKCIVTAGTPRWALRAGVAQPAEETIAR